MGKKGPGPGFMLIEIMVALVIMGLAFSGIYTLYLWGVRTWQSGISRMDNQQNARIAMDYLVEELRFASRVQIYKPHEIRFWFTGDSKTHIFRLAGEEIVLETKNSHPSHNKIALGVTGLTFQLGGGGCILITLTSGTGQEKVTISSGIRPRNTPRSFLREESDPLGEAAEF